MRVHRLLGRGHDSRTKFLPTRKLNFSIIDSFLPFRLTDSLSPSAFQIQADFNVISELAANTFSGLSNLTTVNLTHNRLEKFAINSLTLGIEGARAGGGGGGGRGEHWTVACSRTNSRSVRLPVRPFEQTPSKVPQVCKAVGRPPSYLQTDKRPKSQRDLITLPEEE